MFESQIGPTNELRAHIAIYRYVDDSSGRDQHRTDHRAFLGSLYAQGRLVFCGPFTETASPGAILMMLGSSAEEVHGLLDGDPFHRAGLILQREVREFRLGIGSMPQ